MNRFTTLCSALLFTLAVCLQPVEAFGQDPAQPAEITHGGYAAVGGAIGFSVLAAGAGGLARVIYSPPLDANCQVEPERCRRTTLDHVLVGSLFVGAVAGTYFAGYGAGHLAEKLEWNPRLGWQLAGGYLGVPTTLLLQQIIPDFEPLVLREILGITLGAAGSFGAAVAFGEIAERRGHAWPEFGFGAGGMAAGLLLGNWLFPDTPWVPVLGGLTAIIAASAATLSW